MNKSYILALFLVLLSFAGTSLYAQVPLKVWDQVIGSNMSDAGAQWVGGTGFKLVKTNYGMALVWNANTGNKSGNLTTDDNPGNKPTGVVFGMNPDGSKRFDKRFLVSNCTNVTCYDNHYFNFNYERFWDATINSTNGNLMIAGTMNAGSGAGNHFFSEYEIDRDGKAAYGHLMWDMDGKDKALIKYREGTLGDPFRFQTVLFTATRSPGNRNAYLYDELRTIPYNDNCFNITGGPANMGFIMRDAAYATSQSGISSHNLANIMGEKGEEQPFKVLQLGEKYFPSKLSSDDVEYYVGANSTSNDRCFFQNGARGKEDILILGINSHLDKKREIRIGGAAGTTNLLIDMAFTKDNKLLILTATPDDASAIAGGDFTTAARQRILKYDPITGNKIWEKAMFVGNYTYSPRIIAEDDGGFMIFSLSTSSITGQYISRNNSRDVTVQKFDANGNRVWDYRFGSDMDEEMGFSAIELGNGEYAFSCGVINNGVPVSGDRTKPAFGGPDDIWVMKFKNYPSHSIAISSLDKSEYLLGVDNKIDINYNVPANFNTGNQFYAQLSDANGNFISNDILGLTSTQVSGKVSLFIPAGLTPGNYRVRILSTEPRDTSLPSASFTMRFAPANTADSLALVNFYNSTGGNGWANKTNWLSSSPLQNWYGVGMNIAGRVVQLHLPNNNLSGTIPVSIGDPSELTSLDLSYNPNLSGSIPPSIGNLSKLIFLWLGENNSQLNGTLPTALGNLVSMQRMIISGTQITGDIPPALVNLSQLKYLRLSNNKLTGSIPVALGGIRSITDGLDLSNNLLTGAIPELIGNLGNAREIKFNNNLLSGPLPFTLAYLGNLNIQGLDLSQNKFNFDGLETLTTLLSNGKLRFVPQSPLVVNKTGCTLSVSAGGNLANNTYLWITHNAIDTTIVGDSIRLNHKPGLSRVQVTNSAFPGIMLSSNFLDVSGVLPAQPQTLIANAEQTDAAGWTHYDYRFTNSSGLLDYIRLLSLKKNGNDIGSVGNGSFQVKVVATAGAGSGTGLLLANPLIGNPSGFYVMHRYWSVVPAQQPTTPVGVRFYYTDADFNDVKGSVPWLTNHTNLFFYKSVGGSADPVTNLSGATALIGIYNGTQPQTNSYVYTNLGCGQHQSEYQVSSFSGGGGGGTANGLPLPIKLLDFTARFSTMQTILSWTTSQEQNASHFAVQRGIDGRNFSEIGKISAKGNSNLATNYTFTDAQAATLNDKHIYYRLEMVDLNGRIEYSKVLSVDRNGSLQTSLNISPNPVTDRIKINWNTNSIDKGATIFITDIFGRRLLSKKIANGTGFTEMSMAGFAHGIYWISLESGGGTIVQKVVKQ